MVRVSDARMSGTAYGTVVLHVCPEAAAGGTLALVENGDIIELDVEARRLHLEVEADELARRREGWQPPAPAMTSGYQKLYVDTVLQACDGADLEFLRGCRGAAIPRESHRARPGKRSSARTHCPGNGICYIDSRFRWRSCQCHSSWCARSTRTWCCGSSSGRREPDAARRPSIG
jgi:hypothetical protein